MKFILFLLVFCLSTVSLSAQEQEAVDVQLKYINLPNFRTGETGPLWGRVVLKYNSDDLKPIKARVSIRVNEDESWQEGEWCRMWPGVSTALPVAIKLSEPEEANRVFSAGLRIELEGNIVLSRIVDLYVREHGMFFRTYRSDLDDTVYPYALYLPEGYDAPGRAWPLVVSLHGAYSNHANNLKRLFGIGNQPGESDELVYRSFPTLPKLPPVAGIVVCPWGRGTMGYHGPGERDVMDVLAEVRSQYSIDPERISITGLSMGGNGTWEMVVRHPGLFSAAVPVCPPADMGSYIDTHHPDTLKFPYFNKILAHQQVSNRARNARYIPLHIYHGTDDPVVPISHSHMMVETLTGLGIDAPLTTFDNVQHNAWDPTYVNGETLRRLMGAKRDFPAPKIELTTCNYGNARYQWLEISRFAKYGDFALIEASWDEDKKEIILEKTDNIAGLTLFPDMLGLENGDRLTVKNSGGSRVRFSVNGSGPLKLKVSGKKLSRGDAVSGNIKRKGVEGPVWTILSDRVIVAYGSGPGGEETLRQALNFLDWGELPDIHFILKADSEVSEQDIRDSHLVLFGDERSNSLIARINGKAPVRFEGEKVVAGKDSYPRDEVALKCLFPNPIAPNRLVMINFAEEWDYSRLWSFRGVCKMMPDYMIYRRGNEKPFAAEMLKAGFFGDDWSWQD